MVRKIEVYASRSKLFNAAAGHVTSTLKAALEMKGRASFVLSGGNTPKSLYELLAEESYKRLVDWNSIHFFWGDERCVPPDDPSSNYGMAYRVFLSKLKMKASNVHRMAGELHDHDAAAAAYEDEIRNTIPGGIPSLDLVLLGMGGDGHTASLFPNSAWDDARLVVANYVPKLQSHRLSMTPRLLNGARTIIFLVSGADKAKALSVVLEDPQCKFPATQIRPAEGSLIWLIDDEAASLLKTN
jgi:6-phosphogluconolactonase